MSLLPRNAPLPWTAKRDTFGGVRIIDRSGASGFYMAEEEAEWLLVALLRLLRPELVAVDETKAGADD